MPSSSTILIVVQDSNFKRLDDPNSGPFPGFKFSLRFLSSHQWGKLRSEKRPESEHSSSAAFVSNLPYPNPNTRLPLPSSRTCLTLSPILSAATEDATRAIELKNGSSVGGRKIGVKLLCIVLHWSSGEKPVQPRKVAALWADLADKENCSEKQRVTRTVIFGGLRNTEMAEAVHRCAKESSMVCAVTYSLPKEELDQHGLAQDGCKMDASAVLFTSVKSAHVAVAKLHQKEIQGGIVWARQLGGEAKLNEIKGMFSAAGFVWDVFFLRNSEKGQSKVQWENVWQKTHRCRLGLYRRDFTVVVLMLLLLQMMIKFLKTVKKGKVVIKNQSRGVAFDQFSEHQHALGALRVLNNNPETFGPEHRPIVEFAVDNVQTLKLRKAKLQAQQQDASDDSNNAHQNAEDDKRTRKHSEFKKSKMEDTVGEGEANKKPKLNPAGEKTKPSPSKENSEGSNRNSKGSNRKSKNCKTDPKPVVGSSDNVETNNSHSQNPKHLMPESKVLKSSEGAFKLNFVLPGYSQTLLEDQEKSIKSYPPLKCSPWSSTPSDGNKTGNINRVPFPTHTSRNL
ncbi:hypothetical protein GOBAR_AA14702 [Gossypium barbadense]|uniref:RRM domain-containing protein n=1 Tax=Gossypium barbadense TaxID=3634 RepID=A0A2P5XRF8_GOSBA|nr:hypothetical protein GOBAR_AA14702 [Gossypium barbadense]